MHEILDHDDVDLVTLGGSSDLAQQVFLPIGQYHPAHLLVRIPAHRFQKGLLNDRPCAASIRAQVRLFCGRGRFASGDG